MGVTLYRWMVYNGTSSELRVLRASVSPGKPTMASAESPAFGIARRMLSTMRLVGPSSKVSKNGGVHGKNMEQMGFYMILWGLNMACNGIVMRLNGNFMRKVRKNTGKLMFHWEKIWTK